MSIHLKDSIKIAKVAQRHNKNAFLGAPVWHTLEKCPGMRKKDGKILVSISIHFEDDDTKLIQKVSCMYGFFHHNLFMELILCYRKLVWVASLS